MVPAAVLIAFLLLGVEEIGVQIEEPFGILPLGATSLAFVDNTLRDINNCCPHVRSTRPLCQFNRACNAALGSAHYQNPSLLLQEIAQ